MLWLSEILMQQHDVDSFKSLEKVVAVRAQAGEVFFQMDIRPPFADTPLDWEVRLEAAFTGAKNR